MSKRDYLKYLGFATAAVIATKTEPPMTLPQEMIDAIEKDASDKTKAKEIEIKDRFYKYSPNKVAYLDGYETGRIEGATEWAGKAQELADALMLIYSNGLRQATSDAVNKALLNFYGSQAAIDNAFAKYKEKLESK
jgi:hypothetical protein